MGKISARDKYGRVYHYMVGDSIGSGALGEVFLAERLPSVEAEQGVETSLDRVALKFFTGSPMQQAVNLREARLLKFLMEIRPSGPRRIVRIGANGEVLKYDSGYRTEQLIELEYLDGKTLRAWLDEDWTRETGGEPLKTIAQAARFARELAEALAELEEASERQDLAYLHRDLKPENVMVTADGLRLFDFNVATDKADQTMTGYVGTNHYMAPETNNETVRGGDKADLYSLGIIFWELLHRERPTLDRAQHPHVDWPSERYAPLDESNGDVLDLVDHVLSGLICDADNRLESPRLVIERLQKVERRVASLLRPVPEFGGQDYEEILKEFDLVELLCELSPGGAASVVADVARPGALEAYIRDRTRVADPLEEYLANRVRDALERPTQSPQLLMLSGNAGDGKSYLLERLIYHHFVGEPALLQQLAYVADATHAPGPETSRQEHLEKFFAPFARDQTAPKKLYIIAMNTGMVIQFFEAARTRFAKSEPGAQDFSELYTQLRRQLGLDRVNDKLESRYAVEVINLDLRSLLHESQGKPSFFERMIQTLDPDDGDSLIAQKFHDYEQGDNRALCPVRFNLRALQREDVRKALLGILRRAELDPDIHLSPRNLWGFLYRLITGGRERYTSSENDSRESMGEVIRKRSEAAGDYGWLLDGHFYELLFSQAHLGGVWRALAEYDPAYKSVPSVDRLQTLLTVRKDYDASQEVIEQLGGHEKTLEGLPLDKLLASLGEYPAQRRNDAAVRRKIFFESKFFDKYYQFGLHADFEALLDAYAAYSHDPRALTTDQQKSLRELGEKVRAAVISSFGRQIGDRYMLRVSQPNVQSTSVLLVDAAEEKLRKYFSLTELIQPDIHIQAHLQDGRDVLLEHLGYRPKVLTLNLAGHRLVVDFTVYEFLNRVQRGQQPSAHDLTQFQALRFIAERLGNELVYWFSVK